MQNNPLFENNEDGEELYDHIREVVNEMVLGGLLEVVAIGEDGEWFYAATEKGIERYNQISKKINPS